MPGESTRDHDRSGGGRYRPDLVSFTIENSQQAHPEPVRSSNREIPR
jgi:hypothetical protein